MYQLFGSPISDIEQILIQLHLLPPPSAKAGENCADMKWVNGAVAKIVHAGCACGVGMERLSEGIVKC
jgi:hypothetical protein